MMKIYDRIVGRLSGHVRVFIPGVAKPIIDEHNEITEAAGEAIVGLLARDPDTYLIDTIAVGKGGDCEKDPPHNDTGARVAPDSGEREIRSLVEALPIQTTSKSGMEFKFSALARQEQAVSADINELALLTRSGLMVAHYVTPVDIGGRAEKKPKSTYFWIIEWTIRFDLTL